MFTECDYLIQVERHKDYVAHAERYRRGEANLPRQTWSFAHLRRIAARVRESLSTSHRPYEAAQTPVGDAGA